MENWITVREKIGLQGEILMEQHINCWEIMGLAEIFAEYLECEDSNENTFSSYLQIIKGESLFCMKAEIHMHLFTSTPLLVQSHRGCNPHRTKLKQKIKITHQQQHQATFLKKSTQTVTELTFWGRVAEEEKGRRQHLQILANNPSYTSKL